METGQMNVIKTPGGVRLRTLSTSVGMVAGEQDNDAFSGVLRGLSPDISAQPKITANLENVSKPTVVDTNAEDGFSVSSDVNLDVLASLVMATVQNVGNVSVVEEAALNAAGVRTPITPLTIGRMPESEQKVDQQADSARIKAAILTTDDVIKGTQHPVTELLSDTVAEKVASSTVKVETLGASADVKSPAVTTALATISVQREIAVTPAAPPPVPVPIEIQGLAPITAQNVSQGNQVTKAEELPAQTAESSVPKISVQQIMEAYSRTAVNMSNSTAGAATQGEQSPAETVVAVINSIEAAVPSTQEQGAQKPILMPILTAIPEQTEARTPSVQKASEAVVIPAHAAVKTTDSLPVIKEERQATTASVANSASSTENVFSSAVKEVSSATTSQEAWNGDKPTTDQGMNGQVNQLLQQHMKSENVTTASNTAAQVQGNTTGVSEHIARQVSEHLANHEIKTGSEQIVLRLSPENLGELKVNLRMENQRLTVEIVTDNRMVRNALLQNSDTLKDSLAKQNIKMDSFDVSTGGNDSGFGGRGQNDWRELARNRPPQQWPASGGYRIPSDVVTPAQQAYLAGREHSMLDLHF